MNTFIKSNQTNQAQQEQSQNQQQEKAHHENIGKHLLGVKDAAGAKLEEAVNATGSTLEVVKDSVGSTVIGARDAVGAKFDEAKTFTGERIADTRAFVADNLRNLQETVDPRPAPEPTLGQKVDQATSVVSERASEAKERAQDATSCMGKIWNK